MEKPTVPAEKSTPPVDVEAKPPQPAAKGKNKTQSQVRRDRARLDGKRAEQGDKFLAAENARIRKELGVGSSALFDALKDRSMQTGLPIVVSSRGVGLGVHATVKATLAFKRQPRVADIPVRELYRVGLFLFEAKLGLAQRDGARLLQEAAVHEMVDAVDPALNDALAHGPWLPMPLIALLNSFGIYEEGGIAYVPRVLKEEETGRRAFRYIPPDPCNVRISNLRRILITLADERVPRAAREHFLRRNPIPFIEWDDDYILQTQPDAVIGQAYTLADFRADLAVVSAWCEANSKLRDNTFATLPELTSKGSSVLKIKGACLVGLPSATISEEGRRATVTDVEERLWASEKPNVAEWMLASCFGFREQPDMPALAEGREADVERLSPHHNLVDVKSVYPIAFSGMMI